ncbi:carbohydrate ABC transporter permease [Mahella australiensis]|uniref:Binding-protein-dependent transport systems inner membrane component n=1 Tax=Mahella australiensis (strain DSM 15567 / CIP 107919 / 50-1 BON) TaxID=697281 RepID=F4A2J2_MAHA5|nr:sugar ABC transporter permease [Mahella australiensis]AEE97258.1 binding-protein-dependent transport systems inner membrane component [Mahella australiensis 50-1 BON]
MAKVNITPAHAKHQTRSLEQHNNIQGWLFLLPAIIAFGLFKYYPIIEGIFVSFFRFNIANPPGEFVGLQNYIRMFSDADLKTAALNTIEFTGISFLFGFWGPIVLAILMNEVRRFNAFFRTMYYIPAIAPGIAMLVLWKYIWNPDYGLANYLISLVGLPPQLWLNDPAQVKWVMFFPGLIIVGGTNYLIYLAAVQDTPIELFEAASIDGAGFFQKLWHILLPSIMPVVQIMALLQVIGAMQIFDQPMIMTGGGPAGASETISLYAFKTAYTGNDYGYAMAILVGLFIVLIILSYIQIRMQREED